MAKRTRNEFSNEPIFVTSFMKNISKEAISQRIMALIYHFQCIAIEMNGRDPHMKAYRSAMTDAESGLGIDFDKHTWTYSLRSKKLLSIDTKIEGTRVILDFHFYNQNVEKQTGIAEEFPPNTVKEEIEAKKVVFEDDDDAFNSLCVGGSNFKSKETENKPDKKEKTKQEEPKPETPAIVHNRKKSIAFVTPKYDESMSHDEIVEHIYKLMDHIYHDHLDMKRFARDVIYSYNYEYEVGDEMLSLDELSEKLKDEELFYDTALYGEYIH